MGTYWYRMRLKADVDTSEAAALIEIENTSFYEGNRISAWYDPEPAVHRGVSVEPSPEEQRRKWEAMSRYTEVSALLKAMMDIYDDDAPPADFPVWHSVRAITDNELFPMEWHLQAYRSFLPDQLPAQFELWQGVVNAVREGAYSGYL